MENRETSYRRSGQPKHKRIIREAVKTIMFYENLASSFKKRKKTENYNAMPVRKAPADAYDKDVQEKPYIIHAQYSSEREKREKNPIKMEKEESGILSVELTKEEWNALHDVLKDLQSDKGIEEASEQTTQERSVSMSAVNKEIKPPQPIMDKKQQETKRRKEKDVLSADFSFLDFDQDFDMDMLWDDTNLDDYADILSAGLLQKLKEERRNEQSRQIKFIISEEDYEEEIQISEEDYDDTI